MVGNRICGGVASFFCFFVVCLNTDGCKQGCQGDVVCVWLEMVAVDSVWVETVIHDWVELPALELVGVVTGSLV